MLFRLVSTVLAAGPNPITPGGSNSTTGNGSGVEAVLNSVFDKSYVIITILAGAIATFYLIYQGIQYITAGGSADKAKAARQGIVNAIIGIIVITAAYAIIRIAISIGSGINGAV